jgi:hypothetical protein
MIISCTSFLAVRLLVGPRPVGLAHTLLGPHNLPARGACVDGAVAQVTASLMDLTVNRVQEDVALLLYTKYNNIILVW